MLGWSRRLEVSSFFEIEEKCCLLFTVVYPSSNYVWRASLLLNLHTTHKCASMFINIEIISNQDGTESYLFESSVDHPPPTGNFFHFCGKAVVSPCWQLNYSHDTKASAWPLQLSRQLFAIRIELIYLKKDFLPCLRIFAPWRLHFGTCVFWVFRFCAICVHKFLLFQRDYIIILLFFVVFTSAFEESALHYYFDLTATV